MSDYPGEAILEEEKQRAAYLESHPASSPEEPPIEADAAAFESPTSVSPEEQYDVDPEIVEVDAKVVGEVAPTAVTEKDATATDEEQGKIAAVSSSGTSTKEANEEETTGNITESPLVEGEVLTDEQGHGTKPTTGTSNSEEWGDNTPFPLFVLEYYIRLCKFATSTVRSTLHATGNWQT